MSRKNGYRGGYRVDTVEMVSIESREGPVFRTSEEMEVMV
jgi:hypothetical protein